MVSHSSTIGFKIIFKLSILSHILKLQIPFHVLDLNNGSLCSNGDSLIFFVPSYEWAMCNHTILMFWLKLVFHWLRAQVSWKAESRHHMPILFMPSFFWVKLVYLDLLPCYCVESCSTEYMVFVPSELVTEHAL